MAPLWPFRDINIHISPSAYFFSSPSNPSAPALVIERPTGDVRLAPKATAVNATRHSSTPGILGIVTLRLDSYIIYIKEAKPVGTIHGERIYRIESTGFLPLRDTHLHDKEEDKYLLIIKSFLKISPLHFSYGFDVTSSFQRIATTDLSFPLWQRADNRFFWNHFLQSHLIDFRNGASTYGGKQPQPDIDPYILPVMFGMLEIKNVTICGHSFVFILSSRRSRFRGGTRYFSRGIDEDGNVSNFNETEQTIIRNDKTAVGAPRASTGSADVQVFSYVQTRGSIPLFWAEVPHLKWVPKLKLIPFHSSIPATKKHFTSQLQNYGEQYLVNLINGKGRERYMKEAYENVVEALVSDSANQIESDYRTSEKLKIIENDPDSKHSGKRNPFNDLHYVYYDFHNETRGLQFGRAKQLITQLEPDLIRLGYFSAVGQPATSATSQQSAQWELMQVRSTQTGVVRTNCMDCLDRTNLVQSLIARFMLDRMLSALGVLPGEQSVEFADRAFDFFWRNVWADNADVVSCAYSGTGALKTDFTRTGIRTYKGALADGVNSATRFALNNFADGARQDAFDLLLGYHHPREQLGGSASVFADTRPLAVRSVPYILGASVFLMVVGSFSRRDLEGAQVWPFRVTMIVSLLVSLMCLRFIFVQYGPLYVDWPKLNPSQWATDTYFETLDTLRRDKIFGSLVAAPERGRSKTIEGMEEGNKKRIE